MEFRCIPAAQDLIINTVETEDHHFIVIFEGVKLWDRDSVEKHNGTMEHKATTNSRVTAAHCDTN